VGDIDFPGHVPQPQRKLVIEIALGEGMDTPEQVRMAVDDAMWVHGGMDLAGTRARFDLLPRAPHGELRNGYDRKVGEWRITS